MPRQCPTCMFVEQTDGKDIVITLAKEYSNERFKEITFEEWGYYDYITVTSNHKALTEIKRIKNLVDEWV